MFLKTLSVIAASLLIVGCSVQIQPYYSEANETYRSSSISTNVSGIAGDDEELSYPEKFGVVNAIDNDKIHYTLIVPTHEDKKAYGDATLSLYNFHHAAFLTKKTLEELIEAVDSAINDWTTVYASNKAHNISYLSGSDKSSVDFHYQNGAAGEVAFLDINSGEEFEIINDDKSISTAIKVYHHEIRSLEVLQGFSYLLHKAEEMYPVEIVTPLDSNTSTAEVNATVIDSNTTESKISDDLNMTQPQESNITVTPSTDNNNSVN